MTGIVTEEIRSTMDDVHLVIPACSEFLRPIRLVAADAAVRAGLDCEEVEDFRIAVDELCHAMMTTTDHHLHVTFRTSDDKVTARGSARSQRASTAAAMSELSNAIVSGVADFFDFRQEKAEVTFLVVKHANHCAVDHR
jgi:predicted HAD superfamily Cof-like phosphohydrolase